MNPETCEPMKTSFSKRAGAIVVALASLTMAGALQARDPGINQPGAVGNAGAARRTVRR